MTPEKKALVTATVGTLRAHGVVLTTHFYRRLFEHNPELKNVFNMGNQQTGKQQTALAMAVLAYAENIEDPSVLVSAVTKIGYKHVSLDIRPEHYAIVGRHLIASIGEVLGEAATPALLDAWTVGLRPASRPDEWLGKRPVSKGSQPGGRLDGLAPLHRKAESSRVSRNHFLLSLPRRWGQGSQLRAWAVRECAPVFARAESVSTPPV
jgi:hemoglobin-like flavoprotein